MISDSKRREVSRKLRMLDVDGIEHGYELLEEVADCIGDEGVKYGAYERFAVLLADLIEPSDHIGDSDKMVDREALLEEVKELEKCAWYFGLDFDADEPLRDRLKEASEDFAGYARRIREACGAVDAG